MKDLYLYNESVHTLHIKGLCHHTKPKNHGFLPFETENDAVQYAGRTLRMCQECLDKRESVLAECLSNQANKSK